MADVKPVKCWNIEKRGITVCEGDKAVEKGDWSVGIPSQDVTVLEVFPGETDKDFGSVLVKPERGGEPYEESLYMFQFEEEMKEEEINELKFQLDMCIDEYNRVK